MSHILNPVDSRHHPAPRVTEDQSLKHVTFPTGPELFFGSRTASSTGNHPKEQQTSVVLSVHPTRVPGAMTGRRRDRCDVVLDQTRSAVRSGRIWRVLLVDVAGFGEINYNCFTVLHRCEDLFAQILL